MAYSNISLLISLEFWISNNFPSSHFNVLAGNFFTSE